MVKLVSVVRCGTRSALQRRTKEAGRSVFRSTCSQSVSLNAEQIQVFHRVAQLILRSWCFQVPVFQRGGSVVCRSTGSGSCSAEFQRLPLTVTVALDSQVGATESAHLFQLLGTRRTWVWMGGNSGTEILFLRFFKILSSSVHKITKC